MPNEIISNGKKYSGNYPTNLAENVVSFESADETNPTSFQEMPQLVSPGRMKTLMRNLSIGYKNLRYLVKLFGTTDISTIGDGTVSGGLKLLNDNIVKIAKYDINRSFTANTDSGNTVNIDISSLGADFIYGVIPVMVGGVNTGIFQADVRMGGYDLEKVYIQVIPNTTQQYILHVFVFWK